MRIISSSEAGGQVAVVAAVGEIDLATVPALRQAVSDQISAGSTVLVLDLSEVTFIDSTGLGVLVGAGKKAAGIGGSLRLVCDNPRILRLLRLTGLSGVLAVHATREEALAGGDRDSLAPSA